MMGDTRWAVPTLEELRAEKKLLSELSEGLSAATKHHGGRAMMDVRSAYEKISTDVGKAVFAHRWLENIGADFTESWTIVYDLLRIVRDTKLYARPTGQKKKTWPTFEAYFEEVMGRPLRVWSELEATHQFCTASGLLSLPYEDATARRRAALEAAQAPTHAEAVAAQSRSEVGTFAPTSGPTVSDNITNGRGTASKYLLGRLKRLDTPEAKAALEGYLSGTLSAHEAAISAGIRKKPSADAAVRKAQKRAIEEAASSPIAEHGGSRETEDQADNVRLPTYGNHATYLTRRLARDAPEIAAKLAAGEYSSVRAAALDAGIVKPTDPVAAVVRAYRKLDAEGQAAVLHAAGCTCASGRST